MSVKYERRSSRGRVYYFELHAFAAVDEPRTISARKLPPKTKKVHNILWVPPTAHVFFFFFFLRRGRLGLVTRPPLPLAEHPRHEHRATAVMRISSDGGEFSMSPRQYRNAK